MSNTAVLSALCYLGLLRFPEQLEPALSVLPKAERTEVLAILADIKNLPKPELLRRWSNLRDEEYLDLLRNLRQRTGVRIDELPPSLREQWVGWLAGQHV
jgi:hypothetical protein